LSDGNLPRLAFDCSGGACSAGILVGETILAERFARMDRGQAELLLPQIRDVLREAGLDLAGLGAIVTTIGPGSFTGLRIGLAAAHGLALGSGRPILAPTSFAAFHAGIAPAQRAGMRVAVAIDSRRGPVFLQVFGVNGAPEGPPRAMEPSLVPDWLGPGQILLAGDSTRLLPPRADIEPAAEDRIRPIGIMRAARDLAPGPALPLPLYLREPDVTQPKPPTS